MHQCSGLQFLVLGSGSIGTRHFNNLVQLKQHCWQYSYREQSIKGDNANHLTLVQALEQCDAVVIANQTHKHIETATMASQMGKHLYIEKPLSHQLQGLQQLATAVGKQQLVVECGFMLRCHPNAIALKQALTTGVIGEVYAVRAMVGQWLPDWRPGGGVVFDLIHELDLLYWLFGSCNSVSAMLAQSQTLDIETEAVAQITMRWHTGLLAQVHLDYLRPTYGRNFEIMGSRGVLYWDYVNGTVSLEKSNQKTAVIHRVADSFTRNHMFLALMSNFVTRCQQQETETISPLLDSIAVQKMADAVHQSNANEKTIKL